MYNDVVKREKRWKWFMLVIGVPICFGANTDDEMAAIFSRCTKIGEKYYVCRDCVLNFDSLLAYPCSAIMHVEPQQRNDGIRITYGAADQWDYMYYDHHHSRDRAMNELLHIIHA